MLLLALSLSLAAEPSHERALKRSPPAVTSSARLQVERDAPVQAGVDVQLDSVVFFRARLTTGPSITPRALSHFADSGLVSDDRSPWWGRTLTLQVAWSPVPWVRIGALGVDALRVTRTTEASLAGQEGIAVDSRGTRSVGALFGGGVVREPYSVFVMASMSAPIGGYRPTLETSDLPASAWGNVEQSLWAEGRVHVGALDLGLDAGLLRRQRSRGMTNAMGDGLAPPRWSDLTPWGAVQAGARF